MAHLLDRVRVRVLMLMLMLMLMLTFRENQGIHRQFHSLIALSMRRIDDIIADEYFSPKW